VWYGEGQEGCGIEFGLVRLILIRLAKGLPDDVEPIAFTPLGYPADQLGRKSRKSLDEIVRYERW
jgi:nitroreductase